MFCLMLTAWVVTVMYHVREAIDEPDESNDFWIIHCVEEYNHAVNLLERSEYLQTHAALGAFGERDREKAKTLSQIASEHINQAILCLDHYKKGDPTFRNVPQRFRPTIDAIRSRKRAAHSTRAMSKTFSVVCLAGCYREESNLSKRRTFP